MTVLGRVYNSLGRTEIRRLGGRHTEPTREHALLGAGGGNKLAGGSSGAVLVGAGVGKTFAGATGTVELGKDYRALYAEGRLSAGTTGAVESDESGGCRVAKGVQGDGC